MKSRFTFDADGARKTRRTRDDDARLETMSCCCGSKIKSRSHSSCKMEEGQRIRCSCLRSSRFCTAKCKCRGCCNLNEEARAQVTRGCRCGEDRYRRTKELEFVTCADVQGRRMSKCPCYSNGRGCDNKCRCINCENVFGASNRPFKIPQPKRSRMSEPVIIGCRCGEERKTIDPDFVACNNVQGQRKSRCPCFRAGKGCSEYCKCFNCKNNFGISSKAGEIPLPKRERLSEVPRDIESDTGEGGISDVHVDAMLFDFVVQGEDIE